MSRGTVTVPSRSYPAVEGRLNPGLPVQVPGGQAGPAPLPSRATTRVVQPAPGTPVPGGNFGPVNLYTPAVDKEAPYFLGHNEGFSVRTVDGAPLRFIRRMFNNNGGAAMFRPALSATPDWTSNAARGGSLPTAGIPTSAKQLRWNTVRRAAYQDEQLFTQLTDRRHPWPIQKPVPFHLRAALRGQPRMSRPSFPLLTRYTPAASYSQTTRTLVAGALTNVLPQQYRTPNPQTGGGIYGSY